MAETAERRRELAGHAFEMDPNNADAILLQAEIEEEARYIRLLLSGGR